MNTNELDFSQVRTSESSLLMYDLLNVDTYKNISQIVIPNTINYHNRSKHDRILEVMSIMDVINGWLVVFILLSFIWF